MKLSEIINELIELNIERATNRYYWARGAARIDPDTKRIGELNGMLNEIGENIKAYPRT